MTDWIVMSVLDCWDYTEQALKDCLAQEGVNVQVLVINQGSSDETRGHLENRTAREPRLHVVTHDPPMPSLGATWNAALDTIWWMERKEKDPLVWLVNNDVRVHPLTYTLLKETLRHLGSWLVSAVGVTEEQWEAFRTQAKEADFIREVVWDVPGETISFGGPDFSCFVISRTCHRKYRFDECFKPCYTEDVSYHRRMLLGGDGKKIHGINLPYRHFASRTINRSPEAFRAFSPRYERCVQVYTEMWGGKPNEETYTRAGDPTSQAAHVTTPELQRGVIHAP